MSASRTGAGEILNTPLNGEYIEIMMNTAAEAASEQIIKVTITVALGGTKRPKLMNITVNHDVTTTISGVDREFC